MFKDTFLAKLLLLLFAGSNAKNACKKYWHPQCREQLLHCQGENKRLEEFNQHLKDNSFEDKYNEISKMYEESMNENEKLLKKLDSLEQQLQDNNAKFDDLQSSMQSANQYSQRVYAVIEEALNPNIANMITSSQHNNKDAQVITVTQVETERSSSEVMKGN